MNKVILFIIGIVLVVGIVLLQKKDEPQTQNVATSPQASRQETPAQRGSLPNVSFLEIPSRSVAGEQLAVRWEVRTDSSQTIAHTAVHWGTESRKGKKLGKQDGPQAAGYPNLTTKYAKGEFSVPGTFSDSLSVPPDASMLYMRAHAIVNGENYWSNEVAVPVSGDGDEVDSSAAVPEQSTKKVTMRAGNLFFSPSNLQVNQGDKISLTIQNSGFHTFTIRELGVDVRMPSSGTYSVEFTANKKGNFEYYCAVPGHREGGMFGNLGVN